MLPQGWGGDRGFRVRVRLGVKGLTAIGLYFLNFGVYGELL